MLTIEILHHIQERMSFRCTTIYWLKASNSYTFHRDTGSSSRGGLFPLRSYPLE
jgi:hypothetical protein